MGDETDDIRALIAAYCQLCDDGRFVEWGELFTAEATMQVMGASHAGRAALVAFIEAGQPPQRRGKHLVSEPRIVVDRDATGAATRGAAWTDYVFVDQERRIANVGRYHDRLVLDVDGRWRFVLREIVFRGDEPVVTQPPPG